jgi:hypothetical protein
MTMPRFGTDFERRLCAELAASTSYPGALSQSDLVQKYFSNHRHFARPQVRKEAVLP